MFPFMTGPIARFAALSTIVSATLGVACSSAEQAGSMVAVTTTRTPAAASTGAATPATAIAAGVRVRDAWARSTAGNPDENTAVYMVIENPGGADRLIGATVTPAISRVVELHVTEETGGQMVMRPVTGWDVPANGGSLELKPAGNHVMLIGLNRQLKVGDTLAVTLKFEKAGEVRVDAPVRDAVAGGMAMPKS